MPKQIHRAVVRYMIYNSVFEKTKFKSIKNAQRREKKLKFLEHNGKVYRLIWTGDRRGKIGQYIEKEAFDRVSYGTDFNGYGWENHHNNYFMSAKDGKVLLDMYDKAKALKKNKKVLTEEDIIAKWAKSLVRKSENEVTYEDAVDMARGKLEYKRDCIKKMEDRQQLKRYSKMRQKLINKMIRENPLRRIVDHDHAMAIISASRRHNNTNYELYLEIGHDMEESGELERGTAKEYAYQRLYNEAC